MAKAPHKPQSKGKISSTKAPSQKPKHSILVVDGGGKTRWVRHTDEPEYTQRGGRG